jgi:hypothetical protein
MTQALHFWSLPVPRTASEADAIFNRLSGETRKQNAIFRRLAARLTARYPCITKLAVDDESAVWSDGPLDGVTDGAVYGIGIRTEHLTDVVPFVVETATSIGLVVHDALQGSTWLPGGVVIDGERYQVGDHLGLDLSGPFDAALVERTVHDALFPILASEGFDSHRTLGIWRTHADGNQVLRYAPRTPKSDPAAIAFDVDIVLVDNGVGGLINQFLELAVDGREKHVATAMGSLATMARFHRVKSDHIPMKGGRPQFEVRSADELRDLAIRLRRLVANEVRPNLDRWQDSTQMAIAALDTGFESHRIIGSGFEETPNGFTKMTFAANLLSTDRCGGSLNALVLAAVSKAPHLRQLVDEAYGKLEYLPAERQADEKRKLDTVVEIFRQGGKL